MFDLDALPGWGLAFEDPLLLAHSRVNWLMNSRVNDKPLRWRSDGTSGNGHGVAQSPQLHCASDRERPSHVDLPSSLTKPCDRTFAMMLICRRRLSLAMLAMARDRISMGHRQLE